MAVRTLESLNSQSVSVRAKDIIMRVMSRRVYCRPRSPCAERKRALGRAG